MYYVDLNYMICGLLQGGLIPEGSDTISIVSRGSTDERASRTSSRGVRNRQLQTTKKKPTSILRHVLLRGMTTQLGNAAVSLF